MLGSPLQLLLNAIESLHGHEAVIQTLREAGLPTDLAHRLNEPYADREVQRWSAAAFQRISMEDIAEAFFKDTLVRFPTWFTHGGCWGIKPGTLAARMNKLGLRRPS